MEEGAGGGALCGGGERLWSLGTNFQTVPQEESIGWRQCKCVAVAARLYMADLAGRKSGFDHTVCGAVLVLLHGGAILAQHHTPTKASV